MNKLGAYKKKLVNIENLKARHELLFSGLKYPKSVSSSVAAALIGQRAFCALSIVGTPIKSISLNTFKTLADGLDFFEDGKGFSGFSHLDSMRNKLKQIIEIESRETILEKECASSKESLDLKTKLIEVQAHNIRQANAYSDLYGKINTLVKEGEMEELTRRRLFKIIQSHYILYGTLFNPSTAFGENSGEVVSISARSEEP